MRRALSVACLLLASGCADSAAPAFPQIDNVVFVTLDTLRADHTSLYGYSEPTTPFLEELAARGVTFDRAYSHSSTTVPSHATMFTGLYPMQNRVQSNGTVLDRRFTTLAEHLRDTGFATAAFVSAPGIFDSTLVGQGFEKYDDPVAEITRRGSLYRHGAETVDRAAEWLESRTPDDGRFFLWVHMYDPHRPLQDRPEQMEALSRDRIEEALWEQLLERRAVKLDWENIHEEIRGYDAEILYTDQQLRRLHEVVSATSSNTLFVVTSDHGQGLTSHGWFGHHRQIYNTSLWIPMVFVFPGDWRAGERVTDQLVGLIDLSPTFLELLRVDMFEQAAEVQGSSFTGLFDGGSWDREYLFAERRVLLNERDIRSYEPGIRHALQDLTRKYILFSEGPDEYYRLDLDPYEQRNRIDEADSEARRMRDILESMAAELESDLAPGQVDSEARDRLRSLGYIR